MDNLPDEHEVFECKGVEWEWYSTTDNIHIGRVGTLNLVVYKPGKHVKTHLREPLIPNRSPPYPYKKIRTGESKWYKPSTWKGVSAPEAVGWAMERIVEHEESAHDPIDPQTFIPQECLHLRDKPGRCVE